MLIYSFYAITIAHRTLRVLEQFKILVSALGARRWRILVPPDSINKFAFNFITFFALFLTKKKFFIDQNFRIENVRKNLKNRIDKIKKSIESMWP